MHHVLVFCDVVTVVDSFEGKDQVVDACGGVSNRIHFPSDLRGGTVVGRRGGHELVHLSAFDGDILWKEVPFRGFDVCQQDDLFCLRHIVAGIHSRVGPNDRRDGEGAPSAEFYVIPNQGDDFRARVSCTGQRDLAEILGAGQIHFLHQAHERRTLCVHLGHGLDHFVDVACIVCRCERALKNQQTANAGKRVCGHLEVHQPACVDRKGHVLGPRIGAFHDGVLWHK